jgi:hypothetical protein
LKRTLLSVVFFLRDLQLCHDVEKYRSMLVEEVKRSLLRIVLFSRDLQRCDDVESVARYRCNR